MKFEPACKLEWVVSPLQESPYVEVFDLWNELEDRVTELESTCDAFDLEYARITDLRNGES
jgi:hypothetical protein